MIFAAIRMKLMCVLGYRKIPIFSYKNIVESLLGVDMWGSYPHLKLLA